MRSLFKPALPPTSLRPYQQAAIDDLRTHVLGGIKRVLLVIPTGGGKTLTASEIIRLALSLGNRVLFVVHLRELVDQTVRALERLGVDDIGVMRGDDGRVNPHAMVQVASIQTLARRQKPAAGVVILDEAHRSLADSYGRHVFEAYEESVIIGLTATPCRGDGRPLGERYEAMVVGATYSQLIADRFISEPRVIAPKVAPDLSSVRRVAGDFDERELDRVMRGLVGEIIPTWQQYAEGRSTVVFASGIEHSKDIARRFQAIGVAAEHLDGTTPSDERNRIIEDLRSGRITVLSNCAVLTEGFDAPEVRCCVIARPTLSLVLHMQTAGRALRPGAVQPLIIDHANNVERHGLPHEDREWSLDGPVVRPKAKNPFKTCKGCFAYIPMRATVCPYCGFEHVAEARELPDEEPAEMVEISQGDAERAFYLAEVSKCRRYGMKPGAAAYRFKERFGRWPPWAWSKETQRTFAEDWLWKEKVDGRARERAASEAARGTTEEITDDSPYAANGGGG